MSEQRNKLDEIASMLRQVDKLMSLEKSAAKAIRFIEVLEVRDYRLRQKHVDFKSD